MKARGLLEPLSEGPEAGAAESRLGIPEALNATLAALCWGGLPLLLFLTARAETVWAKLVLAILFSFAGNTMFSLLHEAVHGSFSRNRVWNDLAGILSAALFPTGFTFQRICHLGHHRRNRTDAEMFDLYYPEDSRLLKRLQLYGILTGLYWFLPPLGSLAYLVWPGFFRLSVLRGGKSAVYGHTGAEAMMSGLDDRRDSIRIRAEILVTVAIQSSLFLLLGLDIGSWLLCYFAFGLNWSSLQYTDHAFSRRSVCDGAWNLAVPLWVRAVFLNYHLHLAHHQNPAVPWIHLPAFVPVDQPLVRFWSIYFRMWRGPEPAREPEPAPLSLAEEEV